MEPFLAKKRRAAHLQRIITQELSIRSKGMSQGNLSQVIFALMMMTPRMINFLVLRKFKFLAASKIEGLLDFHADGVLGIGRDTQENGEKGTEFLDFVAKAEEISRDKQFSLHITPSEQLDLVIIFGAIDPKYTGNDPEKYHVINVSFVNFSLSLVIFLLL